MKKLNFLYIDINSNKEIFVINFFDNQYYSIPIELNVCRFTIIFYIDKIFKMSLFFL